MKTPLVLTALVFTTLCFLIFSQNSIKNNQEIKIPDGQYFGLKMPGMTPEIFAPGIPFFKEGKVSFIFFAPDGKAFYFTAGDTTYYMKLSGGHWKKPEVADFLAKEGKIGVLNISPDGKLLLFNKDGDIMECKSTGEGWSSPEKLPGQISSDKYECGSSMANDHSIFYASQREGTKGHCDIYYSKFEDGKYLSPVNLEKFNTPGSECGVIVSPEEEFIVFTSYGRPSGYGINDMYVSFPLKDGSWSEPQNMGAQINTAGSEWPLCLSPDGKCFFFVRSDISNNSSGIYWVDSKIISQLKNN
jgi:hypothetical protein